MRQGSYINFPEVSRLIFSLGDSRPPNDRKKDVNWTDYISSVETLRCVTFKLAFDTVEDKG